MYQSALATYSEIGDKAGAAMALSSIGLMLSAREDLGGAREKHKEALAISNELGMKEREGLSCHRFAELSIEEGRLMDAEASAACFRAVSEGKAT